jgi:NAD(P)-dependent dehydrogenase (short-subunit alcohol dehydrogenase family)
VAVGRRSAPLDALIADIGASGSAQALSADISCDEGIEATVAAVGARPVAAIVHAAGRESLSTLAAADREEVEAVFATNVVGPLLLTRALQPHFAESASVVFNSSIAAVRGRDRHAVYAASKAALLGLTRNLAVELAPAVRINCLMPGPVQTPMLEQYLSEYLGPTPSEDALKTIEVEARRVPLGRIAEPREIAATAAHLLVDATAVTGAVLPVDLGYTAR